MMSDEKKLESMQAFSILEACKISGLGRSSLYEEMARGKLKARKAGKRTIILASDLRDYMESLPPAYAPKASN